MATEIEIYTFNVAVKVLENFLIRNLQKPDHKNSFYKYWTLYRKSLQGNILRITSLGTTKIFLHYNNFNNYHHDT